MRLEDFMYEFFTTITTDEDTQTDESSPFEADGFDAKARKVYYGDRSLPKKDANYVKSHFNENAFLSLLENRFSKMDEHVQINFENALKEYSPEKNNKGDPAVFACDIFTEFIDEIINKKRALPNNKGLESNSDFIEPDITNNTVIDIKSNSSFDEQTLTLAKNFCIDHETEKELIPLCQIGNYINPLHKHVREMYTEYNRLSKNVQKAIMYLSEIPFYEFEEGWEYSYLKLFSEDAKKLNLSTELDLLYDGGKYFHRAKKYSDITLDNSNPLIFPAIPNKFTGNRQVDLMYYIEEYLFYRNNKEFKEKLTEEVPFEWMKTNLGLEYCPEDQLTYYMCLYIYSASHVITREYGRKNPEEISFTTPNLEDIETMEDFYYAALMALYNIYC